jgi:predicted Zn-dependent protease
LIAGNLILHDRPEALNELQKVPADDYRRLVGEGVIAARSNRKADALRTIDALKSRYGDTINYQLAQVYAQVGDSDNAIHELESSWSKRDAGLASMQVDPFLDPLRKDPRYRAIERRLYA